MRIRGQRAQRARAVIQGEPAKQMPNADLDTYSWLSLARWIGGGVLCLFGAFIIGINWATLHMNSRLQRAGSDSRVSTLPFAGPLFFSIGAALVAWPPSVHVWWCWLIDWPTALMPLALLPLNKR